MKNPRNPKKDPELSTTSKYDKPVGMTWRILSIIYDSVLSFALLIVATILVLPISGGKPVAPGNHLLQLYLFYVIYLFFTWFWIHGGQTLGMKAWRIRLVCDDGKPLNWTRASLRFFAALLSWALLGGGFLWALFDKNKRCLHDILTHTHLVYIRPASTNPTESKQTQEEK